MASSQYDLFGSVPSQGSGSLYNSGSLPAYNSGFGQGAFQPTSNAVRAIQPPQFATATIKNPAQGARIGQAYNQYDANRTADQSSLSDFVKQYVGANPAAKQYTDQESSAIGGFYNGGVQNDLNRLADQSSAAGNLAAQRALGQAGRQSAAYRLVNGNSSYADKQLADQFSNIAIQNALRDSQQRQQNYLTVLAGQQGNLGVRGKLQDNYLNRFLVPGQQSNLLLNNQLGTLGTLGNLDYANTSYGAPQQQQDYQYQPGPVNPAITYAQKMAAESAKYRANPLAYLSNYGAVRSYTTPQTPPDLSWGTQNIPMRTAYPQQYPGSPQVPVPISANGLGLNYNAGYLQPY